MWIASQTAALAVFNPGPTYSVGIPSGSTISDSTAGGIYFQLSAPTSYAWAGLGIGEQMRGATIFVMYADGKGNVTISGRAGNQGHVQPVFDSSLQAGVTLLAGSGIVDGKMVANVHCKSSEYLTEPLLISQAQLANLTPRRHRPPPPGSRLGVWALR